MLVNCKLMADAPEKRQKPHESYESQLRFYRCQNQSPLTKNWCESRPIATLLAVIEDNLVIVPEFLEELAGFVCIVYRRNNLNNLVDRSPAINRF